MHTHTHTHKEDTFDYFLWPLVDFPHPEEESNPPRNVTFQKLRSFISVKTSEFHHCESCAFVIPSLGLRLNRQA